jgi:hypothetical protein
MNFNERTGELLIRMSEIYSQQLLSTKKMHDFFFFFDRLIFVQLIHVQMDTDVLTMVMNLLANVRVDVMDQTAIKYRVQ